MGFSIRKVQPKLVAVIVIQELVTEAAAMMKELKREFKLKEHYQIPDDSEDPTTAFLKFNECFEWMSQQLPFNKIIVDISGGFVPLRFGISLGAISHNLPVFYQSQKFLGTEGNQLRFEDDVNKNRIVMLSNPLQKVGLLDAQNAIAIFNKRSYAATSFFFQQISNRVDGAFYRHIYNGMYYLAEGYRAWDEIRYTHALHMLGKARKFLSAEFFDQSIRETLQSLIDSIDDNIKFLSSVKAEKIQFPLIFDFYQNARRRIHDEKRYDDGVARLYRVTEMVIQYQLKQKSIDSGKVHWDKINKSIVKSFCERKKMISEALPPRISLFDGLILLDCYQDGAARQIIEELETELLRMLGARNRSILAHGVTAVREKLAYDFDKLVFRILEIAFPGRMLDQDFLHSAIHIDLDPSVFNSVFLSRLM